MKRYLIEEAKCGITNGGMACGPVFGNVAATIKFKEKTKSKWLSMVEVDGIPNYYITDKDIFDDLIKEDFEDEEFTEYLQEHFITEFNGLELGMDYTEFFDNVSEDPDNPAISLIRYMIALIRCASEDVEKLVSMAAGNYSDEIDIPVSDVEEEYEEENDEDWDEDEDE